MLLLQRFAAPPASARASLQQVDHTLLPQTAPAPARLCSMWTLVTWPTCSTPPTALPCARRWRARRGWSSRRAALAICCYVLLLLCGALLGPGARLAGLPPSSSYPAQQAAGAVSWACPGSLLLAASSKRASTVAAPHHPCAHPTVHSSNCALGPALTRSPVLPAADGAHGAQHRAGANLPGDLRG